MSRLRAMDSFVTYMIYCFTIAWSITHQLNYGLSGDGLGGYLAWISQVFYATSLFTFNICVVIMLAISLHTIRVQSKDVDSKDSTVLYL